MAPQPSCVYNVPMALDLDLSRTAGLYPHLAYARNQGHIYDIQRCTVGPMPLPHFIETFLPHAATNRSAYLSHRNAFNGVPSHAESVSQIYEPLASALNKRTKFKSRCPGFVFLPTFEHSSRPLRLGYAKPHICCVKAENASNILHAHPDSRVEFGYAELFIHIVGDPTQDIFVDPPPGSGTSAQHGAEQHEFVRNLEDEVGEVNERNFRKHEARYKAIARAHGLHVASAVEVFARQQRLFLFTISLAGSMARFHRWDRSGCVVSESFNIHRSPEILTEFLWRFSQLSDAGRGHDLTFRMASAAEESLFKRVVGDYLALQLDGTGDVVDKALLAHYCPGHVTDTSVTSHSSGIVHETRYIISRPVVSPLSLDGRSTRGYWAVDAASGRIAFLKDTWRTYSQREVEGDILHELNTLGVHNVPILAVHGDVVDPVTPDIGGPAYQETQTNRFVKKPWASLMSGKTIYVSRRRHYRLVTDTVGQSLKALRGSEELLHSTYDVFVAMRDALDKDSRIHRDLSVGNVILVKERGQNIRRGYLIDWDASIRVDEHGQALQAGRAGTFTFSSIRVLNWSFTTENGKHTFLDDMESLIYVVLYCALLYLPHNQTLRDLTDLYQAFFDQREEINNEDFGGQGKSNNAYSRYLTRHVKFGSAALQEWLDTVLDYHTPQGVPAGKGEKWKPETLDAYWSQFLGTYALEKADRTIHQLLMTDRWDPDSPYSPPIRSRISHRSQRDVEEARSLPGVTAAGRHRKRSGGGDSDPDAATSSPSTRKSTRGGGQSLLRRSLRIRERLSRN